MQPDEKVYFECTNVYTKDFIKEYNQFQSGEYGNMSVVQFAKLQSIAVSTFYKYVNILNKKKEVK